ncbi:WG repeat-containing protein [Maribacter sp. CXY002]|uniref:WG repeat-containing protein n=1 Tax=Maribacter luteocoastalis TaxID=3407671 RepID=UPI003B676511
MKNIVIVIAAFMVLPVLALSQTLSSINTPIIEGLNQYTPFHEGLAAVRKGNQWGFINEEGTMVIDFRDDVAWNAEKKIGYNGIGALNYPQFTEGFCMVMEMTEEGIPLYGFMDKTGKIVIKPEYVNLTPFKDGHAIGIFTKKTFRGENEFQLKIYDYAFTEVLIDTQGEIVWPVAERDHIIMSKRRFELPNLWTELLGNNLIAVKMASQEYEIRKINL